MGSARARARVFLAVSTVGVLALIGVAALLIAQSIASGTRADARLRATHGVDLLVTIGEDLPNLSRSAVAGGLSPAAGVKLDAAVARGPGEGLLANLVVWDSTGRVVYSSLAEVRGHPAPEGGRGRGGLGGPRGYPLAP
jgi:hypothetical protein